MKKYNLKKIMKRAWEIKKLIKSTFATALKISWYVAKKEVELKQEWYVLDDEDARVTFNMWSNYGHLRAYYKRSFVTNYQNGKGHYVDLDKFIAA